MSRRRLPLAGEQPQRSNQGTVVPQVEPAALLALPGPSVVLHGVGPEAREFVSELQAGLERVGVTVLVAAAGEAPGFKGEIALRLSGDAEAMRRELIAASTVGSNRVLLVVGASVSAFAATVTVAVVPPGRVPFATKVDVVVTAPARLLAERFAAAFSLVRPRLRQ